MHLFAQYTHTPLPPEQSVIDALMLKHPVIGTLKSSYESFYARLIKSVLTTYDEFTQFDTVGASRDNLMDEYMHMIDTLFYLLSSPKPFNTVEKLYILPAFIFDILKLYHNLEQLNKDYLLECTKIFGEEFAMYLGRLMFLLEGLEKDSKKLKKSKPKFEQGVKEFLQTYFMIVLELRSREG
ncbi:MAG: hypothetical protein Q9M43_07240 [Sulfurimonas sp.]|nr:hypothetical protein [Sulfurimonas sp.]